MSKGYLIAHLKEHDQEGMDIYTLYKIVDKKEWLLVCKVDYSKSIIFTNCSII